MYVETFRNVPLLLWLVFTYAAIRDAYTAVGHEPSNRGIALAWPQTSTTIHAFQPWLLAWVGIGIGVWGRLAYCCSFPAPCAMGRIWLCAWCYGPVAFCGRGC